MTEVPYKMNTRFYSIADEYDLLNLLITFGLISIWRAQLKKLQTKAANVALDLACGTGANLPYIKAEQVFGLDIDLKMLKLLNQRFPACCATLASAEKMPFSNSYFDCIFCSFGFRNFHDIGKVFKEISRILKDGGELYIIEIFRPVNILWRIALKLMFKLYVIPIGKILSKNPDMYEYFLTSILSFLTCEEFLRVLEQNGFNLVRAYHWGPLKILKITKA